MMSCGEHPEEIEEIQETEETEEIITHVEVTALMLRNIIIIKMIEKKLTLVLPVLFQSRKGTTRQGYEKEQVVVVVEEEEEEEEENIRKKIIPKKLPEKLTKSIRKKKNSHKLQISKQIHKFKALEILCLHRYQYGICHIPVVSSVIQFVTAN
jgi:hypothetical protein